MLTFKPIQDDSLLKETGADLIFSAVEADSETGFAYMKIDGFFCEIFKVAFPKDKPYIFQGLVRACLNAATNKNAYIGKLTDEACFEEAKTMNFIFDGKCYSNDIPTLLMGYCENH